MKFNIKFDPVNNIIRISELSNELTFNEVKDICNRCSTMVLEQNCYLILCDIDQLKLTLDTLEMIDLAKLVQESPTASEAKTAIIYNENYTGIENLEFFQQLCTANGYRLRIFTSGENALKWLTSTSTANTCRPFRIQL
ncbi:MAG: hypothetical protein JW745_08410 [Sedimentisphaerales bacterium]|nr:hypothetical protein [Sedimentisphaerales bacterium]MBN2842224.1 hypothetical protein [Sedimentisphaerales bacterium]